MGIAVTDDDCSAQAFPQLGGRREGREALRDGLRAGDPQTLRQIEGLVGWRTRAFSNSDPQNVLPLAKLALEAALRNLERRDDAALDLLAGLACAFAHRPILSTRLVVGNEPIALSGFNQDQQLFESSVSCRSYCRMIHRGINGHSRFWQKPPARELVDKYLANLAELSAPEAPIGRLGNPLSGSTCNCESRCNSGVCTARPHQARCAHRWIRNPVSSSPWRFSK